MFIWEVYIEACVYSGVFIRLCLFRNGTEFEVDVVLDRSLTHDASTLVSALGILDSRPSETN
jgi:hypothetical protein